MAKFFGGFFVFFVKKSLAPRCDGVGAPDIVK